MSITQMDGKLNYGKHMIALKDMRLIEVLVDGVWTRCTIGQIEVGDTFRLTEPDGTQVSDNYGNTTWVAAERASILTK